MFRSVIAMTVLVASGHATTQVVSLECRYSSFTKPVTYILDLASRSGSVHYGSWDSQGGRSFSATSVKPDPGMITIRYSTGPSQGWDTISRTDLTAQQCYVGKNATTPANGYCEDGTCTLVENSPTKF